MKKTALLLLSLLLILSGCSITPSSTDDTGERIVVIEGDMPNRFPPENPPANADLPGMTDTLTTAGSAAVPATQTSASGSTARTDEDFTEMRAVWFSYLEFQTLLTNKTEAQFTANIKTAFDNVAGAGFNSVWVQVRPFGDALYNSGIFPYSYILTGTEGVNPGYDPLAIMVREAHSRGLSIEAWINPYRIRTSTGKALSSDNPATKYINSGSDAVIRYGNMTSYNPASQTARDLITKGVVEIIENYDVDGIHFDDYFYPTTDLAFDSSYYSAYKSAGGKLSQADWRRENVNKLVKQVYAAIKAADENVIFGISPQANMNNNYDGQFADVSLWLRETGYVDYICPQVYFGFNNATLPFAKTVRDWSALVTNGETKLYIGMAPYKIGTTDAYAGTTGRSEWITDTTILARMVTSSRGCDVYHGFAMYRYDFLFAPGSDIQSQMTAEMNALKALMQD